MKKIIIGILYGIGIIFVMTVGLNSLTKDNSIVNLLGIILIVVAIVLVIFGIKLLIKQVNK